MEQESFENDVIAEILNREYVCVKVDREERPDVDSVYMAVCQAMNGQGGWPLTIIMTPDRRPFFSGTYLPPKARYGRTGLEELLTAVAEQWKEKPVGEPVEKPVGETAGKNTDKITGKVKLIESAERIEAFLKEQEQAAVAAEPKMDALHQAFRQFFRSFDQRNGGFGEAPKFPTPHNLLFLMEYGVRESRREAVAMAEMTLVQMYRGGIFDHIGGGFSRYSTDDRWLVPHFEKMLYDNALLVIAYVKAYALTGRPLYGCVARKILDYVERELTDMQGGFYCGQDADSDGVEGKYYVFTPDEITMVLGGHAGATFCRQYGIDSQGNFEGKSIPNLLENEAYEAISEGICDEGLYGGGTAAADQNSFGRETEHYRKLYEYRVGRARLHKDDKILVSWNGWMICACARAGAVLGERRFVEMAVRAEAFIRKNLVRNGRLNVRYREGDTAGEGKLDDYACYALGLLELYGVTFQTDYLKWAAKWADIMIEQFFDWERGGFYLAARDGEQLIVRTKETYDGAMPSGNSVAARVLQVLAQMTGEKKWQEALDKQLLYLAGAMEGYPSGSSYALLTMMNVLYPTKELVCTLSSVCDGEERKNLTGRLAYMAETVPGLVIIVKTKENEEELGSLAPFTRAYHVPEEGALFYYCSGGQCMPPVSVLDQLQDQLHDQLRNQLHGHLRNQLQDQLQGHLRNQPPDHLRNQLRDHSAGPAMEVQP